MNDQNQKKYSREDINKAFDNALNSAQEIHELLRTASEDSGYIINAINAARPRYEALFDVSEEDEDASQIVASGISYLDGLNGEFTALKGLTVSIRTQMGSLTNSTGTFVMSSDSSSSIYSPKLDLVPIPFPPHRRSREIYSEKLRELKPSLADTYDEIWQTYFGTNADPHRAALYLMRTLFDNFFAFIAPDDEVRESSHWKQKDGEKPNQIWKTERIAYALERNIQDEDRRNILEKESVHITTLYKAVNMAHDRDALDEDKSSKTVLAMDSFIQDWLDNI